MTAQARRIARNTVASTLGHGVGQLSTLLFLVVFARSFGADALGEFWFAMSVGAVAAVFVARGVNSLLTRTIARQPESGSKIVGAESTLQIGLALAALLVLAAVSAGLTDSERGRVILVTVGGYQLLHAAAHVYRLYFNAREAMHISAALEVGHKLFILGVGVVAISLSASASTVLLTYPLSAALLIVAGFVMIARRDRPPMPHLDLARSVRWTVDALPLFLRATVAVLLARTGVIALGTYADAQTVGYFAAAERLMVAADLPFIMLTSAVFPVLSRLADDAPALTAFLNYTLRLALSGAIVVAGAVWLLRQPLIALVFGDGFAVSASILGVLAAGVVFTAVNTLLSMTLIATGRLWRLFACECASLMALAAVLILAVPKYGGIGLALAILASKSVRLTGLLVALTRDSGYRAVAACVVRAAVVGSALALLLWLLRDASPALAGTALCVTTVAALLATGLIRIGDISMLSAKLTGRPL